MSSEQLSSPLLHTDNEGDTNHPPTAAASSSQPRILDREGRFSQSRGRWSVANTERGVRYRRRAVPSSAAATTTTTAPQRSSQTPPNSTTTSSFCNRLFPCTHQRNRGDPVRSCWDDWFHTISYTPTFLLLAIIFLAYFATVVVFAGLYYAVNKLGVHYGRTDEPAIPEDGVINGGNGLPPSSSYYSSLKSGEGVYVTKGEGVDSFCGMDVNSFMEALYFSLSTMATIGYGTSDYYFGNCWTPFFLVLCQVFAALAFSSLAIGLLFQRMSRGQKRGRTIVFSDVAVIRKVRGQWYWMFRVAELRTRHIIGAKVRVFCVRHERCPVGSKKDGAVELETAHFVSHPLLILGGSNVTAAPSSGLAATETKSDSAYEQSILMGLPHVVVHRMGSSSPMMPPRPTWYDEKGLPHGSLSASRGLTTIEEGSSSDGTPSPEEISSFLQDRHAEIIVFLEGTCEITGLTLQARHSYRIEDIAFHHTFAPCVFPAISSGRRVDSSEKRFWHRNNKSKAKVEDCTDHTSTSLAPEEMDSGHQVQSAALEVDFGQFHELMTAPLDCESCPYVPALATNTR